MKIAVHPRAAGKKPEAVVVKDGPVSVKIYPMADGRSCIVYREAQGGPRKRVLRKTLAAAKEKAKEICLELLNGRTAASELTAQQRMETVAATQALRPLGVSIDTIAREAAEAHRLSGGAGLLEMARFWARHHAAGITARTAADVHAELLASKGEQALNARYRRALGADLGKFAAAFPTVALHEITSAQILQWLRDRGVGWRRRNNLRDTVVTLFRFAKNQRYLPQDAVTEPERIPKLSKPREAPPPGVFTVPELRIVLDQVRKEYLPWAVLGAFAGLRPAEIERLIWERDFHWAENVIEISEAVAKRTTRKHGDVRYVDMPANLVAWLADYRHATGKVCPRRSDRETGRLGALLPSGKWPQDGLRHSWLSYLAAKIGNLHVVAQTAGNSTQVARRNYLNPRMKKDAKAWFSVYPGDEKPDNVTEFELPGING